MTDKRTTTGPYLHVTFETDFFPVKTFVIDFRLIAFIASLVAIAGLRVSGVL